MARDRRKQNLVELVILPKLDWAIENRSLNRSLRNGICHND